ncbi:MAG: ATP-binding protein [Thermoleophilaceae bacterium]
MAGTLEHATLQIRPDPAELARTREFVRARAAECGLDEEARFRAALVVTEAVTNAMRHGRGSEAGRPIEVRCGCNGQGFMIEVGDSGRFRRRNRASDTATHGRGLRLIERLTRRFDLDASRDGTRLHMLVGDQNGI